tara:strand:- start:159 stop:2519 length:2361 start_codon:yes stop_codon:yes gene_type:complete
MKKNKTRARTTTDNRIDYSKGGSVSKSNNERVKLFMGMDAAMGADFSRQLSNAGFGNINFSGVNFSPVPQTKTTPPPAVSTEPITDPNPQAAPQVFSSPAPAPAPISAPASTYSVNPADNTPVVNTPVVSNTATTPTYIDPAPTPIPAVTTTPDVSTPSSFQFTGGATELAPQILEQGFEKSQIERAGFQRDASGNLLLDAQGNPIPITGASLQTMGELTPVTGQQISADTQETTFMADGTQAQQVAPLTATGIEAAQVAQTPTTTAAQGQLSPEAIAQTLQIDRVPTIEGADVSIEPGAVADRVVGTLSPNAMAIAQQVTGQSVRRITRAKEQLRTAGISEATINTLGDDPEALEGALLDLTDTERGLIQGLPQEALVSTQMGKLLEGIENNEIPTWARPAVDSVERILAERGMSASTVGRDALFNAIIQSALPIAQSNAQAIQTSIGQEREAEVRVALQDAQFRQQTAQQNAQNVFQLDLAQFSADQQTALANSKFLQTVSLTEATNDQQAILQNAVLMSQANISEADLNTRRAIQNSKAFLTMDITNLNNEQQASILTSQQEQQRMLSNQAAVNAARQFNATSENQTQQFLAELNTRINISNTQQMNAIKQFNASAANAAEARRVQNEVAIATANAQMLQQTDLHNSQLEFQREQFNTAAAQQIEQANVQWRRQINLADTAAQNQVNQQNAQNMFGLTSQANAMIWQEMRDKADRDWKATQNKFSREADIVATALSTEKGGEWIKSTTSLESLARSMSGTSAEAAAENVYSDIVIDAGYPGSA